MEQINQLIASSWSILLTAALGYIVWLLKEQREDRKKENIKREANSEGTKLILFYMLQRLHTEYTYQDFVTYNQQQSFKDLYEAYHNLGGNGLGTRMWEDVKKLEVRQEEVGLSLFAKKYFSEKLEKDKEG